MDTPIWREADAGYKILKASWLAAIKAAYLKGSGLRVDALDNLMLVSYRWMKYIKTYLRSQDVDTSYYYVKTPLLPDAIKAAVDAITHKHGIVSLYAEAESLESVSRASYRWLKDNDKLVEPDGP